MSLLRAYFLRQHDTVVIITDNNSIIKPKAIYNRDKLLCRIITPVPSPITIVKGDFSRTHYLTVLDNKGVHWLAQERQIGVIDEYSSHHRLLQLNNSQSVNDDDIEPIIKAIEKEYVSIAVTVVEQFDAIMHMFK